MPERQTLRFEYDPDELGHLGLHLTPVYFNKQLLTRYLYDARFKCEFASATYGTIHAAEWQISFGINKQGAVIAWLGDIKDLPLRERFYWLVENISPQHDYTSEFYDGQIEVQFTPPPPAVRALNAIASFNTKIESKLGFPLYFRRSVEGRIEDVARYSRLILANRDDFVRFVVELNGIITEATNSNDIRAYLSSKSIPFDSKAQGNKLLEVLYKMVLCDKNNLIAPFFYLYDLRIWAAHSTNNKLMLDVAAALKVDDPNDYQQLFETLLQAIATSCEGLEALL